MALRRSGRFSVTTAMPSSRRSVRTVSPTLGLLTQWAEELLYVTDHELGLFGRREVAAPRHHRPVDEVGVGLDDAARDEGELLGEDGDADGRLQCRRPVVGGLPRPAEG